MAAAPCDRGATKPEAKCGATRRAAALFASTFVPGSSQIRSPMLLARASADSKIPCRKCIAISGTPHRNYSREIKPNKAN